MAALDIDDALREIVRLEQEKQALLTLLGDLGRAALALEAAPTSAHRRQLVLAIQAARKTLTEAHR